MNEMELLEWSNPVPDVRGNPGPAPVPVDADAPVSLSSRRRRRAPRRLLAAAAAAVVLAGGAVAFTTLGDDDGTTDLDATAATPPAESLPENLGELVDGGPWRVLADDPEVFGTADLSLPPGFDPMSISVPGQTLVSDMIADGDGWLAVGQVGAPNQSIAAVWESEDGRTWERIDDPVFGEFSDDFDDRLGSIAQISAVAVFGDAVIAAGSVGGNGDADEQRTWSWSATEALWMRSDDGDWRRLDGVLPIDRALLVDGGLPPGTGWLLSDVVATESGFVLAGAVVTVDPTETAPDVRQYLWHSPNGSVWTQVAADVLPDGAGVWSLASSGSVVVAVGSTDGAFSAGDMAAWYSTDGGLTWSAADTHRGLTSKPHSSMVEVVAAPGGFVAVGDHRSSDDVSSGGSGEERVLSGDVDVAVWTSADGRTWSAAPPPAVNSPDRHDRVVGVAALPDGRVVVGVHTDRSDGSGATTLVGPPDRLEVVADTQPFAFQSISTGLVSGQAIAGTSTLFDRLGFALEPDGRAARLLEGSPGALFILDHRDLVPVPPTGQEEPDPGETPGATVSDDEASPDDCVAGNDDIGRSPSVQELRQLLNRATRELRAAGFDVVEGSIGEFVEVCDSVLLDPADEVTLRVYGDVEAARLTIVAFFPGEPIVVEGSELSSEEVSTAVPRVNDALADAVESGLVPEGVQVVSVGGDTFGSADVLVELATAGRELLSDEAWEDLRPAADELAAELSATTGLTVAVERATSLPADD